MSGAAVQTWSMSQRHVRAFLRQPWYVATALVQPVIWLLLFGALFRNVPEIPGFAASGSSYLDYLMPGVIVMTALFSSGWAGMGVIEDIDRGIMDRFLVAPVHRGSLIAGRDVADTFVLFIQCLIMGALGYLLGAHFAGGIGGFAALVLGALLLGSAFGSLSNAMGLVLRQRESVIGLNVFLVLPATFLSSAFMPLVLVPDWIATIAKLNPVNWAIEAGRAAITANPDWSFVLARLGGLAVVAVLAMWLATRAFHSYQRSV
jgi:ABC-2 type transport system permease protein